MQNVVHPTERIMFTLLLSSLFMIAACGKEGTGPVIDDKVFTYPVNYRSTDSTTNNTERKVYIRDSADQWVPLENVAVPAGVEQAYRNELKNPNYHNTTFSITSDSTFVISVSGLDVSGSVTYTDGVYVFDVGGPGTVPFYGKIEEDRLLLHQGVYYYDYTVGSTPLSRILVKSIPTLSTGPDADQASNTDSITYWTTDQIFRRIGNAD